MNITTTYGTFDSLESFQANIQTKIDTYHQQRADQAAERDQDMLTPAVETEIRSAIAQHGECVIAYLEEKFNVLIFEAMDMQRGRVVEILDLPDTSEV